MADQLYLSLWFPNFRLESLPAALTGVLRQFAVIGGDKRVAAASAYPIDFTESPTFQRIFVNDDRSESTEASAIENAVAEATGQLHDDMAYEFEMRWNLWAPAASGASDETSGDALDEEDDFAPITPGKVLAFPSAASETPAPDAPDSTWKRVPSTVRLLGFGPEFDHSGYEQNGHIRVDFGLDTPWTMDQAPDHSEPDLDALAAKHIQQNVEMLLAFTLLVEKNCGISSRLLWTESGEPLAEKLIARLQRLN